MKVLLILIGLFSAVWAAKKCKKTEGDSFADDDETCADAGVCTSPMFVEYAGMSNQEYGCGVCPGDTKDVSCKECSAEEGADACNVEVEAPGNPKKFKCFSYTFVEKKWKAGDTAVECTNTKDDTAIKCNSPGEKADKDYVMPATNGCGPCAAEDKEANKCAECTKDSCNSASSLAFVLVPLLAVIFHAL